MTSHSPDMDRGDATDRAERAAAEELRRYFEQSVDEMVAESLALVSMESPSCDKAALDRLADVLQEALHADGAVVERVYNPVGGDHLRARWRGSDGDAWPVLVLSHFDTVWPVGTLYQMPAGHDGDRAFGPGIYDMKTSIVLVSWALRGLRELGLALPRGLTFLLTSDEELGSPTSRSMVEAEARRSCCAFVMEPPLPGGHLKTQRKGVLRFTLKIQGVPAHAGVEPGRGASAVLELARQILAVEALARPALGTTVNVGKIAGGDAVNVVAERATADIDIRVSTLEEARRMEEAMRGLVPADARTALEVEGGLNRLPMRRTEASGRLFERARALGRLLGEELQEGSTGGGSDGNFTSAEGCPTLDGLGCDGDGAHARHEQIRISALPNRAALLALLLMTENLGVEERRKGE